MARIKKELTELIGGTPLLELSRLSKKHDAKAQIIAKLEYFNPGGSVKDRIALAMIEDAEAKGILKPGAVIIEPTSGNTGVGLARCTSLYFKLAQWFRRCSWSNFPSKKCHLF